MLDQRPLGLFCDRLCIWSISHFCSASSSCCAVSREGLRSWPPQSALAAGPPPVSSISLLSTAWGAQLGSQPVLRTRIDILLTQLVTCGLGFGRFRHRTSPEACVPPRQGQDTRLSARTKQRSIAMDMIGFISLTTEERELHRQLSPLPILYSHCSACAVGMGHTQLLPATSDQRTCAPKSKSGQDRQHMHFALLLRQKPAVGKQRKLTMRRPHSPAFTASRFSEPAFSSRQVTLACCQLAKRGTAHHHLATTGD
ncbi:hypothetical protein CPAR01_05337 [Colletotrichum paranaense]|uniref:Uncharacterized protein n=1 Tax=Colletotrichum paranaense TaxID=1914294 RepID=A0ABQ9SR15_9PEZI|nr:uncharacterized protein CPAR01_05337 [Colletotrichum paranaense]KAK1541950.1 hypothetical protein CPAR01_05337 [Colletotrichum paranaense]